jgi:hypothetical protein
MICGATLSSIRLTFRAQYASMDALSALISSEAFHSSMAGGQLRIIVPALVKVLSQSTEPLSELQLKCPHS